MCLEGELELYIIPSNSIACGRCLCLIITTTTDVLKWLLNNNNNKEEHVACLYRIKARKAALQLGWGMGGKSGIMGPICPNHVQFIRDSLFSSWHYLLVQCACKSLISHLDLQRETYWGF